MKAQNCFIQNVSYINFELISYIFWHWLEVWMIYLVMHWSFLWIITDKIVYYNIAIHLLWMDFPETSQPFPVATNCSPYVTWKFWISLLSNVLMIWKMLQAVIFLYFALCTQHSVFNLRASPEITSPTLIFHFLAIKTFGLSLKHYFHSYFMMGFRSWNDSQFVLHYLMFYNVFRIHSL